MSWLDKRRIDAWHARRRYTLMHGTTGVTTDPPLRAWTAQLYRVTGGPHAGACHDLVRMFDGDLHHCQKGLDAARYFQAQDLEDQAYVLLCAERDRCIQLSFLPTETVEPMEHHAPATLPSSRGALPPRLSISSIIPVSYIVSGSRRTGGFLLARRLIAPVGGSGIMLSAVAFR